MKNIIYVIILTAILGLLPIIFFTIGPIDVDIFKFLLLISTLLYILKNLLGKMEFEIPKDINILFLLLILAFFLLSSFWSTNTILTLSYCFVISIYIWFYILVMTFTNDLSDIKKWLYLLPFSMVAVIIFDFNILIKYGTIRQTLEKSLITILAITSELSILPLLYILIFSKKKSNMVYSVLFILLAFFTLIISQNRAGSFVFIFTILMFLIIYLKSGFVKIKKRIIFILIIPITILVIALISYHVINYYFPDTIVNFYQRYYSLIGFEENTLDYTITNTLKDNVRAVTWKASWSMFLDNPILGVGFGNFSIVLPKYSSIMYYIHVTFPHNIYLALLAETGIVGFMLVMTLFVSTFYNYRNLAKYLKIKKKMEEFFLVKVFEISYWGFLIHSFFRPALFEFPMYLFIAMGYICRKIMYEPIDNEISD